MEYSTFPSPAAKAKAQEERPSYVPYCPDASLGGYNQISFLMLDRINGRNRGTDESPIISTLFSSSADLSSWASAPTETLFSWTVHRGKRGFMSVRNRRLIHRPS